MLPIRQVVQDYGRSCERILSNHSFDAPLSEEEVRFIQYYMNEMEKRFGGIIFSEEQSHLCSVTESQPI